MRDVLGGAFGVGRPQGNGHANDPGDVVSAAAPLALLAAADQQRLERRARSGHQHSDPLRTAELVGRQRQQVDMWRDRAEVEPRCCLNGVRVNQRVRSESLGDGGDFGEVGDGADLVVDRHDADHRDRIRRCGEHIDEGA